ncbi:Rop family plasmid primer RNA-binding protein, partial [Klebsiella pneumoniae]
DLDAEADLCEKLHDAAEHLFRTLSSRLDALQDGN